ncbi:methyltransferase domain-containing protein [Streptomyces alfalfae]|uniref:Protein-L-isoaspartate O-methyltransferase n=1 Tax=Streptomyces alfalfae TaxID=1642299 RepID=A0ABM6GVL4_9ACTN|nr:methyltransferase domain-containing protein [Streptomyces alfalfae]AYA15217.1 methyltransferase domain-containing protein [Streptomyces fradiae]APY87769.1 protein-L-isoaspartate(D-aspartate) O-methyltransferase [Streptomyces alfalfae]QUI32249.1 methyltransferase domain-containing protein [Streptomyces alfalfae]RXX35307.1 methyltransferase domain-containing protein [Streptomyces alfalfae]RZM83845.1 methyltransferase domain-containing protein [Streptomyces alfalfae]
MTWETAAADLATRVTHRSSPWREAVARIPRHVFVPTWWVADSGRWSLYEPVSEARWYPAAYADRSLVTRVGDLHADQAGPDDHPSGKPTSSATLPSLVVSMFEHARIDDGDTLLDVGTGSGYGTALAAYRLGDAAVTSVDVDPYLVEAARDRLAMAGLRPRVETADATAPWRAEGRFDRIVATVSVRTVPAGWLSALRTGGRLVTTIAGTSLILTAEKRADGAAVGRVEWDRAGFMPARHGANYPADASRLLVTAQEIDGEDVTTSPYPAVDVANAWDLDSMLGLTAPGIEHAYRDEGDRRTAIMAHPDGSWARAVSTGEEATVVHQGGPRRLWDILDELRSYWLRHGELPARGARVLITPEGETRLARGKWRAVL